ncbi:MAG: cache domain-containing protein, partial [Thermodesulfobacteriota bacterium]
MLARVKLVTKLIAIFVAVGIIPMLGTGLYSYFRTQDFFKEMVFNENSLYVEQKARMVEFWVDQKVSEVKGMLLVPALYENVYSMTLLKPDMSDPVFTMKYLAVAKLMDNFVKDKGFGNAAVVRKDGLVIFDTNQKELSGEGKNISDRPYFKQCLQGKVALSPIFDSPIIHQPVMVIAGPVYQEGNKGELLGALVVTLPTKPLSDLILDGAERLGEGGDTFMVNHEGVLVTPSRRFATSDVLKTKLETPAVKEITEKGFAQKKVDLKGNTIAPDKQGREMLTSYSVVKIGENYYGLLAEQEARTAMAGLVEMRNVTLLSLALAALLVGSCGFFVARSLARPIRGVAAKLSAATEQAASAAVQVSSSSQSLAEGASEQAASLE